MSMAKMIVEAHQGKTPHQFQMCLIQFTGFVPRKLPTAYTI